MVRNNLIDQTRRVFFLFPTQEFGIRELARLTKLAHPTIMRHVSILQKEKIVENTPKHLWKAKSSKLFYQEKRLETINQLYHTGLVAYLEEETLPTCILLFGSASRGEDTENSDIDLFIESPPKRLQLKKYEKQFKRKINLTFGHTNSLKPEFFGSIINGVILSGGITP